MKKKILNKTLFALMSLCVLIGCGNNASGDSAGDLNYDSVTPAINTEKFSEMLDAYEDYYDDFCDDNLEPYYEDISDCDCAARLVVNPDDNELMLVIADIVDATVDEEVKVDLHFYEYSKGEVIEYLEISNIWTQLEGIYVGNIDDGLYVVCTTYPNGDDGGYEHIQYEITDGDYEELSQTKDDDEEWIDINTKDGVLQYSLTYSLSERIFGDCDSNANKFCVAERDFEDYIDYLRDNTPHNVMELKAYYNAYLVENRITTVPDTDVVVDGVIYHYMGTSNKDVELNNASYRDYDKNIVIPCSIGYLYPAVSNLSGYVFPDEIDGYPVYKIDEGEVDIVLSKYINFFISMNIDYSHITDVEISGMFADLDGDDVPECVYGNVYHINSDGNIEIMSDYNMDSLESNSYSDMWSSGIIGAWKKYNGQKNDFEFEYWCDAGLSKITLDTRSDEELATMYGNDFVIYHNFLEENEDIKSEIEHNGCIIFAEFEGHYVIMYNLENTYPDMLYISTDGIAKKYDQNDFAEGDGLYNYFSNFDILYDDYDAYNFIDLLDEMVSLGSLYGGTTYSDADDLISYNLEDAWILNYQMRGEEVPDGAGSQNIYNDNGADGYIDSGTASVGEGSDIRYQYYDILANYIDDEYNGDIGEGCKFVDIDSDGEPECIIGFGAQFQTLIYFMSDNLGVHECGIMGYVNNGNYAEVASDYDEWGDPAFYGYSGGYMLGGDYYYQEYDDSINDFAYYHDSVAFSSPEEITYSEYEEAILRLENEFIRTSDMSYYSSLSEAWEQYIN